jgi:TATA-binding protein-associated factor Taf7
MTVAGQGVRYLDRPNSGGLVEVVDLILDKGLVIDIYVRVSLVGIELLTIDARIVVASIDTYLRFAEAVNRLDLARSGTETPGLPGMMEEIQEGGAEHKAKGVLKGAKDKAQEFLGSNEDEDDEDDEDDEEEEAEYEDQDDEDQDEDQDRDDQEEPEPEPVRSRRESRTAGRKGRAR